MMENNKGLSAVVTTLIIILLVLVAVGIVWVVVRGVVDSGAEQIELSSQCLAIDVEAVSVSAVEGEAGNYSITIRRNAGGDEIGGLKIAVFNSTDNSGVLDFGAAPSEGETVTQTVDSGITNATKIEYTVFIDSASGSEQLCSQTQTHNI